MVDDTQIIAWLDGRLGDKETEAFEQAARADPDLMARAERHYLTMMRIRAAFNPLLDLPPPEWPAQEMAREEEASEAVEIPRTSGTEEAAPDMDASAEADRLLAPPSKIRPPGIRNRLSGVPRPKWLQWAIVALALAIGVLAGRFTVGSESRQAVAVSSNTAPRIGDISEEDGTLVAAGTLAETLEHGLAADSTGSVRIALSFRDKTGRLCRSFDSARLAGIACRDPDGWRLRLALQTSGGKTGSSESPFVGQAIDAMIAGDPLDASAERTAQEHGWR
jgi:hypothetical protein